MMPVRVRKEKKKARRKPTLLEGKGQTQKEGRENAETIRGFFIWF